MKIYFIIILHVEFKRIICYTKIKLGGQFYKEEEFLLNQKEHNKISCEKIINAALKEFGTFGYAQASTNHICEQYNISKGLLFYYFQNKEQLYITCVEKCFLEAQTCLTSQYQMGNSVEQSMQNYFSLRAKFFKKYPDYRLIYCCTIFQIYPQLVEKLQPIVDKWNDCRINLLKNIFLDTSFKNSITIEQAVDIIMEQNDYICMDIARLLRSNLENIEQIFEVHEEKFSFLLKILLYGMVCQ